MAEDGCINSGIFQNLDILGKVEFKNAKFTGDVNVGTQTSDILTINSRIKMPNVDDGWDLTDNEYPVSTDNKKVLVRQTDNTLRFEPKAERVFQTIIVDNQDNIRASNLADTLTLKPGTNMTIETKGNAITFSSSSGSNVQNIYKTIRVDGHNNDLIPTTSIDVLKFQGASNIDITPSTTTNLTTTYKAIINYDNNLYADNDNENKTITLYDSQTAVVFTMVTGDPSPIYKAEITYTDLFNTDTNNVNKTITLFQGGTDNNNTGNEVVFTMVTGSASALQFQKGNDADTTAGNLSSEINNHSAFSSIIDTENNKIIVSQVLSSGGIGTPVKTFQGITINDFTENLNDIQFKKETDVDTTATNLSTAINNHNAFSSNIDTANNKIIVTQISSGTPTGNTETFESGINGPGNFSQVTQDISTLTIGLKDNKIADDLVIGEDSTDMLLVNSETTFINNTTFVNDVKITDNLQVDNLNLDGNTISSINSNGNIDITPNGTGAAVISKVDINGGNIDGTIIGSTTAVAGTFTELNVSDGNITNVGDISLDSITADDNSSFSFGSNWTAAGRTCADLGTVTTAIINGGNIDGVAIGSNIAAAGTFTSLNVSDSNITNVGDIKLDSITANDDSSFSFGSNWTAAGRTCADLGTVTTAIINGGNIDGVAIGNTTECTILKVDKIQIDHNIISSTDSHGDINITPDGTGTVVISKVDINSGNINGTTIGANAAAAGTFTSLNIDNLSIDDNIISSTNSNKDINITPHGTGKIDAGTADIDSSGIIGNSNATLLGTISASTPLQPNIISVGTLASLDISGDLSVDTNVLKVDSTNNKVGINKTAPAVALDVDGDVTMSGTLTIGSEEGDKRVTYLDNSNQLQEVAKPTAALQVLANISTAESGLSWVSYSTVSAGGIDTSLVTDILSSPLDTDYYVGNDENNLFVSSGKSNFLENVDIIDSILRIDNSSGNAIELEGSNSTSVNPTIKTTNGGINIESSQSGGTILNICNTASGSDSSIGFNVDDIINNQFTIGVDDSDSNKFKIGTTSIDTSTSLTIDSSGNVGIGTTTLQSKLGIAGNVAIGSTYSGNTAPADGLLVEGNVGIGVTTLQSKLGIAGNVAIGSTYSGNTVPADGLLVEGNVGIGVTNPQSKLDIEGSVAIGSAYSGNNPAPLNGLLVEGNVGIGTTSPTHKLEVIGNLHVNGDITTTGSGVGMVSFFVGTSAPTGWLECNGAWLSTSTYPELFSIIQYVYGRSGSNFKLPDFRGYFLRCWHNGNSGPSPSNATNLGQAQSHNTYLPVHNHTATSTQGNHRHQIGIPRDQSSPGNNYALNSSSGNDEGYVQYDSDYASAGAITTQISNSTQYSSGSNESRPHNYSLLCCIRYE